METHRIRHQKGFAAGYKPLPFDGACALPYGAIKAHLQHTLIRTAGNAQPIGERDRLIAAQALQVRAVLVTRNTREFARIPGLVCEDW